MNETNICRHNTIKIGATGNCQSIEITQKAIKTGFLNNFPEHTLAIFLYLITHMKNDDSTFINPNTIVKYLPYKLKEIIESLNQLEKKGFIEIIENKAEGKDKTGFDLKVNLDKLKFGNIAENNNEPNNINENNDDKNDNHNNKEKNNKVSEINNVRDNNKTENKDLQNNALIKKIINENKVLKKDLNNALKKFIPFGKDKEKISKEITTWLEDFAPKVLQELIRRVIKWQENTSPSEEQTFFYLKAIIEDWYEKEIFNYKRLQYFDQLYRETKELAQTYGIDKWKNVETVQMQTFKNWLDKDFALNLSVAKYAITQAIKRKKDGQPSLKYIEDNFIIPFKKEKIKKVTQAQKYLKNNRKNKHGTNHKSNTRYTKSKNSNKNKSPKLQNDRNNSIRKWNSFEWKLEKLS